MDVACPWTSVCGANEVWPQVFGEVGECRDGEVWEELGGLFEEGVYGVVEAAEVGIG